MAILITDPDLESRLRAERAACGGDRFDEVWEGIYVMEPTADDEHQDLVTGLGEVLRPVVQRARLGKVRAGVNVSDREKGWEHNYRVPDLAVFLAGGRARSCGTHWCGGPDLAIEIVSRGDRTREKLDFYALLGVRELLILDRHPWAIELLRLRGERLCSVGRAGVGDSALLTSEVLPLAFRLVAGSERPELEISHGDGRRWTI